MTTPLQHVSRFIGRRRPSPARAERSTRRDRALTERLRATFERDLVLADVRGIHFYVQAGVVTLYGTIRHELDRDMLVDVVRKVPGVVGVLPQLQIVDGRFRAGDASTD